MRNSLTSAPYSVASLVGCSEENSAICQNKILCMPDQLLCVILMKLNSLHARSASFDRACVSFVMKKVVIEINIKQ